MISTRPRLGAAAVSLFVGIFSWANLAYGATQVTLKNGMTFEGRSTRIGTLSENPLVKSPSAGGVETLPIVLIDDGVRRTFFPFRQVAIPPSETGSDDKPIKIGHQRVATSSTRVGSVGGILGATPFDPWGRRTIRVRTNKGSQEIVQGITEISPVYTRVRGLQGDRAVNWDMRIATSSIPSATLRQILLRNEATQGAEARRDVVRLLFQSERYQDAARELQLAMRKYPELEELNALNRQLIQLGAQRLLREIELRQSAGQHGYVAHLLSGFPSENVATENLIQAADMLKAHETSERQQGQILKLIEPLVQQVADLPRRHLIDRVHAEITRDLNRNNVGRMSDFLRLADDQKLKADEKLALAISGWLLGKGEAELNLAVTSSLIDVRELTREYLRAMGEEKRHLRKDLLARISEREGGTPRYLAQLLRNMLPPHDLPETTDIPGFFDVSVAGNPEAFPVRYRVQLPPEYDPYRRYPTIVSLHAAGSAPEAQINWWAGTYDPETRQRLGLATRYGYIVIAPEWTTDGQTAYEYSAREHNVVLKSLRDAMRRYSVDSDRVFLTGHALGGDAAWDMGAAHPDLWAGVMLIGARSDYGEKNSPQYVTLYHENAKTIPWYFVFGELDGKKMRDCSIPLNRYLKNAGFDPIVVQYQGRGNEHFYEEIQRLFRWMQHQQRDFLPPEFETVTMRPWDNFFWYFDLEGFPSAAMIPPLGWPAKRSRPARVEGKYRNNQVSLSTGATNATVWLSPEMIDFEKRIEIRVNGKERRQEITPDIETMLEDARTRADRQHVFWARVDVQTGRRAN